MLRENKSGRPCATQTHGRTPAQELCETRMAAAFPAPPPDEPVNIPETSNTAEATDEEIERAVWEPSTRKAAGPDLLRFAAVRLCGSGTNSDYVL
jgi:hypothetical protein